MSGIPSFIVVERCIPARLLDAFLSGQLRVEGGILRWLDGTGRGRIAGHLTEGWDLAQKVQSGSPLDPSQLLAAVGNAQMAAQLATGIGVLNLGVSVAGFAMIARRLDRIADSILVLQDGLRQVGADAAWLRTDRMHELRAEARTALDLADRGARQNSQALFNEAKTRAGKTRRHLAGHLHDMAASGSMLREDRLYQEFLSMSALLALTEARSTDAVEGAGRAALELREATAELRRASDAFGAPLRNFPASARMLLEVADRRVEVKARTAKMDALVSRLESYVPQLELKAAFGLDTVGWQSLTMPEGSSGIMCVTFDGHDDRDLIEAVQTE